MLQEEDSSLLNVTPDGHVLQVCHSKPSCLQFQHIWPNIIAFGLDFFFWETFHFKLNWLQVQIHLQMLCWQTIDYSLQNENLFTELSFTNITIILHFSIYYFPVTDTPKQQTFVLCTSNLTHNLKKNVIVQFSAFWSVVYFIRLLRFQTLTLCWCL